ncbi:RHTO0S17e02828g2_1 [Rhodotorula toruloides]|uniref:RHTO0S17e02828g2_1 n=1 Tax=Rhodotorula toruloides TaxID=5286 RepID=A0A061BEJ3_RHOTO|nr:RHTO0S17e02828g2_1 [Rhodotorula toruloides]
MHDCSNQLDRTACLSLSPHLLPDEHVVQEHATCRCFRTHASRAFAGSRRPLRHVRTSHRSAHGRRMGLMWTKFAPQSPSRPPCSISFLAADFWFLCTGCSSTLPWSTCTRRASRTATWRRGTSSCKTGASSSSTSARRIRTSASARESMGSSRR